MGRVQVTGSVGGPVRGQGSSPRAALASRPGSAPTRPHVGHLYHADLRRAPGRARCFTTSRRVASVQDLPPSCLPVTALSQATLPDGARPSASGGRRANDRTTARPPRDRTAAGLHPLGLGRPGRGSPSAAARTDPGPPGPGRTARASRSAQRPDGRGALQRFRRRRLAPAGRAQGRLLGRCAACGSAAGAGPSISGRPGSPASAAAAWSPAAAAPAPRPGAACSSASVQRAERQPQARPLPHRGRLRDPGRRQRSPCHTSSERARAPQHPHRHDPRAPAPASSTGARGNCRPPASPSASAEPASASRSRRSQRRAYHVDRGRRRNHQHSQRDVIPGGGVTSHTEGVDGASSRRTPGPGDASRVRPHLSHNHPRRVAADPRTPARCQR